MAYELDAPACRVGSQTTGGPIRPASMPGHRRQDPEEVLGALRDLITALDRRAPRTNRSEERRIAHDAAELKRKARARITEIESQMS